MTDGWTDKANYSCIALGCSHIAYNFKQESNFMIIMLNYGFFKMVVQKSSNHVNQELQIA